jgi:hypothetical protein
LAKILTLRFVLMRFNSTSGVLPIVNAMLIDLLLYLPGCKRRILPKQSLLSKAYPPILCLGGCRRSIDSEA